MKTLLLHSTYTEQVSYFDDWIDAFKSHSDFSTLCINVFNASKDLISDVKSKIENYELIVLHHSMNGDTLNYLDPFVEALKNRRGKLVSFVGNEVNLPTIGMAPKIKNLQEIEADFIATQLLEEAGQWLYEDCNKAKVISLPHALNPEAFFSKHAFKDRKIDIGTRSARYGVYVGDNDRNSIIRFFHNNARLLKLNIDLGLDKISQKKFNRQGWSDFLSSCKATLSTEAGSFYLEKNDVTVKKIQEFLKKRSVKIVLPHETFARKTYRRIVPSFVRKTLVSLLKDRLVEIDSIDQDFNFDEIYEKFFRIAKKAPVYTKAVSSRHFDAIGTKTLHIMYPGRYNDILTPGQHYFELKPDHSNVDELKDLLLDAKAVKKITESAYDHVIEHHTHNNRLEKLLRVL
jgi:spore maturation protein CgeB